MKQEIHKTIRSQHSIKILDAIFYWPYFQSSDFHEKTGLAKNTANGLLQRLKQTGIIREVSHGSGRKPALLTFQRLLDILEKRDCDL